MDEIKMIKDNGIELIHPDVTIYPDMNVVIKMRNDEEFKLRILDVVRKREGTLVYSPAHLEEVRNRNSQDDVKFASFLNEITSKHGIRPLFTDEPAFFVKEDANLVLERVKNSNGGTRTTDEVESFDKNEIVKDRDALNLEKNIKIKIGLTSPCDIFDIEELKDIFLKEKANIERQFGTDLDNHDCYYEKNFSRFSVMEGTIEKLMKYLNKIGYKADKSKYLNGATHDITHGIYGGYCDYFVTDDSKLNSRLKAVYQYIGAKTLVLSYREFIDKPIG